MWRKLIAVVAMALVLTACGTAKPAVSGSAGASKATLGLTYIPNIQFAPAYVAADDHLFGSTDVTLRHHGAQEGLFTALLAGQEDFVIAGGDEVMQARAQGQDVVAVASYYSRFPVEVIGGPDAQIRSLADLKGKKIGVPGRYGESWFGLLLALRQAGLQQSDVQIVEIGYTGQAAITSKKVDAVIGFSNNDAVQLKGAGLAVTEVPLGTDVPLVSSSLVTTAAMIKNHPDVVRAVAQGLVAGEQRAAGSADEAVAATKKRVPDLAQPAQEQAARATWAATVPLFKDASGQITGKLDPTQWPAMSSFMQQEQLVDKPVDATQAFNTTFVG